MVLILPLHVLIFSKVESSTLLIFIVIITMIGQRDSSKHLEWALLRL